MMKQKFILRDSTVEDAAAIASVNMTTRQRCYAAFMPPDFIATNTVTPQQIANWQKRIEENHFLQVAETDDKKLLL